MKVIRGLGLFAIILTGAGACFNPPDFPVTPQIEFESIRYKEVGTGSDAKFDSLILTVSFKDGDGNLGLAADETGCVSEDICYNNKFYFKKISNGQFVTYKDKRTNPDFSTYPAFVKPFNCTNWEVRTDKGVTDTLYFELNPNHYNIEVDFLVKNGDGSFTEFDWRTEFDYPNCGGTFDGRFPVLYKDEPGSPLEGKIRYGMVSPGFKALFSIKTLKLRVQIKDRALNKSNIVETAEFTLQ
jgi:hypothetical protein